MGTGAFSEALDQVPTSFLRQGLTQPATVPLASHGGVGRVNYDALFERIMSQVDQQAYLPLADAVDPAQQGAMEEIEHSMRSPTESADATEALINTLHQTNQIDSVHRLSALHVLAASPKVGNHDLAAQYATEQEMAAMDLGGPRLQANLASVDRHRGVLAYLKGHYEVALDYFSRAFERQHTAGNLSNVLATLIRLGDVAEARTLVAQIRQGLAPELVHELNGIIDQDPDLALLRMEISQ